MINKDRMVPIVKIDLLSMYALILKLAGKTLTVVNPETDDGQFVIKSGSNASAPQIASEPVRSMDFDSTASSVSAAVVYFVAGYDFEGFRIDGVAETPTAPAEGIIADGATLYTATLATGDITVAKVGV